MEAVILEAAISRMLVCLIPGVEGLQLRFTPDGGSVILAGGSLGRVNATTLQLEATAATPAWYAAPGRMRAVS